MSQLQNSAESEPIPPLMSNIPITLQVGERRFITRLETMTGESHLFAALLSGRWDNKQADGSYFVDADPELFQHVLRYLRHGILPIFYDNAKGHDHALYMALLEQARYFQIPRLENWLREKGYLQVVKVTFSMDELHGMTHTQDPDEQLKHYPVWQTRKVYVCPRGIAVHRGDPSLCGRQCRNAQGSTGNMYEDENFLRKVVIRKRTVVDQMAWIENPGEEGKD